MSVLLLSRRETPPEPFSAAGVLTVDSEEKLRGSHPESVDRGSEAQVCVCSVPINLYHSVLLGPSAL